MLERTDRPSGAKRTHHLGRRAAGGAAALVALGAVVKVLTARRLATWGATTAEAGERLPGDELIDDPAVTTTRAITIDAPAAEVWRWLVQIGTGRGGWYSYDVLERMAGVPVHNTDEIRDEWQHLAVGDRIALAPPGWMGMDDGYVMPVVRLDEGSCIVLHQGPPANPWEGVWSFHVRPTDERSCRLVIHSRTSRPAGSERIAAVMGMFMDPVTATMEHGMLRGIKQRAEGAARVLA